MAGSRQRASDNQETQTTSRRAIKNDQSSIENGHTTKELAAEFKVGVRAVDGWVARGAPFDKRHGRRFFDIQGVRKWLAANRIFPGSRGVAGGRMRARQSKRTAKDAKSAKKDKKGKADHRGAEPQRKAKLGTKAKPRGRGEGATHPESGPAPDAVAPGGTSRDEKGDSPDLSPGYATAKGLEAGLDRIETVERDLGVGIIKKLQKTEDIDHLEVLGLLDQYKKVLGELRLGTKGFIEVQVMRGELVRREDLLDKMARLASMVRASYERFGDELPPALIADLGEKGVEVGDIAAFQRSVHGAAQRAVDGWLRQLSDQVRLTKPE